MKRRVILLASLALLPVVLADTVKITAGSGENSTSATVTVGNGAASDGSGPGDPTGGDDEPGGGGGPDSDGDDLPDSWEQANGTRPNESDADEDPDDDGLTNAEEYAIGTYPNNPDSDGDDVNDGEDGWALDKDLSPPRVPESRYAVINLDDLGFVNAVGINDAGQILDAEEDNGYDPIATRLWTNGSFESLPAQIAGKDAWWHSRGYGSRENTWSPAGPSKNGGVLGGTNPIYESNDVKIYYEIFGIPNSQLITLFYQGDWESSTFLKMTRNDVAVGADAKSTGPYSGSSYGLTVGPDGIVKTVGDIIYWHDEPNDQLPIEYTVGKSASPTDVNSNGFVIGRFVNFTSSGPEMKWPTPWQSALARPFIGKGVAIEELPNTEHVKPYESPFPNSINNLTSPWIVGVGIYDNSNYTDSDNFLVYPFLWTKVGGNWKQKTIATYDKASNSTQELTGTPAVVNDRCEILGTFGLIRNGRLVDWSNLSEDYTINPADWSPSQFSLTESGMVLATVRNTSGAKAKVLLLPYEFTEVNPASGFDKYTKPNWLMVPQNQTNWAKAISPANVGMEIKFKIVPGPGGATVTPDHTNQSPETIGVSSPTVGNTTSAVIGIGTAFGTEGLKLAVKKYRHKNVAIHAVTQRYTTPMSLNASANPPEGKSGIVCVQGGSILWSTPGGDDQVSDRTITTGANGVCETTADSHDTQVIPVGQGIHVDLVPQGVPTAAAFEIYINHIFGLQSNIYFTVSRSDAVVDYDTSQPRNKMLDMTGHKPLGPEETALQNGAATPGADINVYFVYEFNYGDGVIGKALSPDIAYVDVRKSTNSNSELKQVAAHEIGHDLGIVYHADQFPSFNSGYLPGMDPKKRLMNSTIQPNPENVLIKAEWDLINKDNE